MRARCRVVWALLAAAASLAATGGCGARVSPADGDGDAGADADGDADADADGDADADTDADIDGWPPGCEPMEVGTEGDCDLHLGYFWSGSACLSLGGGCHCRGRDCAGLYPTAEGCAADRRACYGVGCEPAAAAPDSCLSCDGPRILGALWTGSACVELRACGCAGEGCGSLFPSLEECEGAQAACDAALCAETGGLFRPATPCGPCGHLVCGLPSGDPCCDPGCDCGPGRSFSPGQGCRPDPSCTAEQTCMATGGVFHPARECFCGFACGRPGDCSACLDSCDCGPHRTFEAEEGCRPDPSCEAEPREVCEATGGRWHEEVCGDHRCGIPSLETFCHDPGCDCGPAGRFDDAEGCVWEPGCLLRGEGEECTGAGADSTCRPGLVCCAMCGVEPCASRCMAPCCATSGACEPSGCPLPPP